MKTKIKISFILLFVYIYLAPQKNEYNKNIEKSLEAQMIEVYNQAFKDQRDVIMLKKSTMLNYFTHNLFKANLMAA